MKVQHVLLHLLLVIALLGSIGTGVARTEDQSPLEKAVAAEKEAAAAETKARKTYEARQAAAETAATAEQAVKQAVTRVKEASKAVGDKEAGTKAVQQIDAARNAVQTLLNKARQARDKARQQLSEKRAAVRNAEKTALAEKAYTARKEVDRAEKQKDKAQKTLRDKANAVRKARQKATAAERAANKAEQAKRAAAIALEQASDNEKEATKKKLEQTTAAAEQAAQEAEEARQAADKAAAAQDAARKALAQKTDALTAARDNFAVARSKALGGLEPIRAEDWTYEKARHLLSRAGFGGTPGEISRLYEKGPHQAVDHLVFYHQHPPANIGIEITPQRRRPLAWQRRLHTEARREIQIQGRLGRSDHRRQLDPLRRWWLRRMTESPRPLQEKLTLFWHDHFAVQYRTLYDVFALYRQNRMFRQHADRFDTLIHGIVQDPAMLRYLDNHVNRAGSTNENLGREILELFTMGEENSAEHRPDGYTEDDVRDAATRALTGATDDRITGQFRFRVSWHDKGEKVLLGRKGHFGPHEAVDVILDHPATAEYLSKKLFRFFVHREPDERVIQRMAHVMRENDYRLQPVLNNLFLSKAFYSKKAMGNRIKSPVELMVGTAKVLGMESPDYGYLERACRDMGQTLFEPPDVAGWRGGRSWITAERLLSRYNHVADLVERRAKVDLVAALDGRELSSPAEVIDHLVERCLAVELADEKRQALIKFLGDLPPSDTWGKNGKRDEINARLRAALVMLMSIPEYHVG